MNPWKQTPSPQMLYKQQSRAFDPIQIDDRGVAIGDLQGAANFSDFLAAHPEYEMTQEKNMKMDDPRMFPKKFRNFPMPPDVYQFHYDRMPGKRWNTPPEKKSPGGYMPDEIGMNPWAGGPFA